MCMIVIINAVLRRRCSIKQFFIDFHSDRADLLTKVDQLRLH